jgi:hypothetical protein
VIELFTEFVAIVAQLKDRSEEITRASEQPGQIAPDGYVKTKLSILTIGLL